MTEGWLNSNREKFNHRYATKVGPSNWPAFSIKFRGIRVSSFSSSRGGHSTRLHTNHLNRYAGRRICGERHYNMHSRDIPTDRGKRGSFTERNTPTSFSGGAAQVAHAGLQDPCPGYAAQIPGHCTPPVATGVPPYLAGSPLFSKLPGSTSSDACAEPGVNACRTSTIRQLFVLIGLSDWMADSDHSGGTSFHINIQ